MWEKRCFKKYGFLFLCFSALQLSLKAAKPLFQHGFGPLATVVAEVYLGYQLCAQLKIKRCWNIQCVLPFKFP